MALDQEEIEYWWSQFPELERQDVIDILQICNDSSDEYHMYKTFNDEAS